MSCASFADTKIGAVCSHHGGDNDDGYEAL
jgi:hypothetical protein